MNFKVETTSYFERRAKPLAKKYPSFKKDLRHLIESLAVHPQQGTSLGQSCFKIRLKIASKAKGKSGGARVITLIVKASDTVKHITIYDKSERENSENKELKNNRGDRRG